MGDDGKRRHRERGVQMGSEHNKSTNHCQVSSVDLFIESVWQMQTQKQKQKLKSLQRRRKGYVYHATDWLQDKLTTAEGRG